MDSYVVFDTETTGLDVYNDEIIEIAAVKVVSGRVVERFEALLRATRELSPQAASVHGITPEMLDMNGQDPRAVFLAFADFIKDLPIIAHNGHKFDFHLLAVAFDKWNIRFGANRLVDTCRIAQGLRLFQASSSLSNLCLEYGITNKMPHRAMGDTEATYDLFVRLTQEAGSYVPDEKTLDEYAAIFQVKRIIHACIHNGRSLLIDYSSQSSGRTSRWVVPTNINSPSPLHFTAHCIKDDMEKLFRIDRINSIISTGNADRGPYLKVVASLKQTLP